MFLLKRPYGLIAVVIPLNTIMSIVVRPPASGTGTLGNPDRWINQRMQIMMAIASISAQWYMQCQQSVDFDFRGVWVETSV